MPYSEWWLVVRGVNNSDVDIDQCGGIALDGIPFTGEVAELSNGGVMIELITCAGGVPDGPHLAWYEDGSPRTKGMCDYTYGAIGAWLEWHENGQLHQEGEFDSQGELISLLKWGKDGNPI